MGRYFPVIALYITSYFVYMSKIACIESHDSELYLNTKKKLGLYVAL
jgi:hypothetical protein